jgi:hypothetical protein
MSYIITLTDGTLVTLIPDDTVNTTALPVNLFGRGYVNYGMALNENFVYMLEHFSDGTSPANPLHGQLWYNNSEDVLYLRSVNNLWVPIQVQNQPDLSEITVVDGMGHAAELDGTGNLYLQANSPSIGFLTAFADPLSSGTIVASIELTSGGVLQITPGLHVIGSEIIQGSLSVSGATTTGSLTVVNSTTTNTLNVTGSETITGNSAITGMLTVGGAANFGFNGLFVASNISALTYGGQDGAVLQHDGILYLTRTETSDYAEIDFDDGTGVQGSIKLTNVGTTGWNSGATNPYVLVIKNGLEVDGNELVTGNLTVLGNIINGSGGAYLPLTGGTLTGNLILNDANIVLNNANHPTIELIGTSAGGTINGQATLALIVDSYTGVLTHYINSGGDHVLYMGTFGDAMFSVNMSANMIESFIPWVHDNTLEIWNTGGDPSLGLFNHSGTASTGGPTLMLCDPGTTGHAISGGWAMGMSMQGDNTNGGSPAAPNNYYLTWGNFAGGTGQPTDNLMSLSPIGVLDVSGGINTYGAVVCASVSAAGEVTAGGNMACTGQIAIGSTVIADGNFANSLSSPGYQKLPGGMIMQWGVNNSAGNPGANVTFPIAFPNACLNIQATADDPTSLNHIDVPGGSITSSGFNLVNSGPDTGRTDGASWFAIGY